MFSLVWLADRLVANLSVSISVDWSVGTIVDWSNSSRHVSWEDWSMDSGVSTVVHQTKIGTGGGQDGAHTQESLKL